MSRPLHIVHLTPGTGSYYCGLCLRDHELTLQLRKLGMTVTQVPLYLPLYTENPDPNEGDTPIFFGAVNAWLQQEFSLFRHTPRWLDSVLDVKPVLMAASQRADVTTAKKHGDMAVSMLQGKNGRQLKELHRLADWLEAGPKPDLICAGTALLAGLLPYLKDRLQCPVLCSLQGEDAFLDDLPDPWSKQAWEAVHEAATNIDGFIAPSDWYADRMASKLAVERSHIQTIYNGIDIREYAVVPPPKTPTLGFFAHLSSQKGFDTIVDAFIRLRQRPECATLRLHAAGASVPTETAFLDQQKEKLAQAGLLEATTIMPNVSKREKIAFFQGMTVFSVPATYGEAFGLYLPEAWAAGIPSVQPKSGAFPELTTVSNAGLVYDPDRPENLDDAIAQVVQSAELRQTLSSQARNAAETLFSAPSFAQRIAELYSGHASGGSGEGRE
jgi:glycosyltransferase involved in cell wall biosynthesis